MAQTCSVYPDVRGNNFPRNVCNFQPGYMPSYSRRHNSSVRVSVVVCVDLSCEYVRRVIPTYETLISWHSVSEGDGRQPAWWYYRKHRTLERVPGIKNVIILVKANFHTRIIFIGYCLAALPSQLSAILWRPEIQSEDQLL